MPLLLDIVTPEKKIFSGTVENIYLPGVDGEMGILPNHVDLVTALRPGVVRYLHSGNIESLAIGSGFAEITHTHVVILTDSALGESEIDEDQVEAAIARAREKLASVDHNLDSEEVAYLQGVIARSAAALLFKRKSH